MKNILLIRVPPNIMGEIHSETAVQWGEFVSSGEMKGDISVSSISRIKEEWLSRRADLEDPEEQLPDEVILFVSGGLAVHKKLEINASQKKHLNTALPFMVEEELAQDIDSIHLASLTDRKTDSVQISAIAHQDMQQLLSLFEESQLLLDRIMVEGQFLESEKGFTTLLLDDQSVTVVSPDFAATSLDYDALSYVLTNQADQPVEDSMVDVLLDGTDISHQSQIQMMFSEGSFAPASEKVENIRSWLDEQGWLVNEQVLEDTVFEYFACRYFKARRSGELIDLRQGAYQCPRKAGRQIRRWRPIVVVAACWFLLELGLSAGQALVYQRQADELWVQTMAEYLQIFPNDQQARNAQAQQQTSFSVQRVLENRLRTAGRKQTGEPFLPLLQKVSMVSENLDKEAKVEPQSMDFNDSSGQLVLEFQAGSLESVDQFLAALNNAGLSTKLDSANQVKTGVLARMTIGR